MIKGPLIINPLASPETTPEQTRAAVAPETAVTESVVPVIVVN